MTASGWKGLAILAAAIGVAGLWLGNAPADDEAVFPMPRGKALLNECGSCHTAYAPGLLPARSWRRMLSELGEHFGEDASLEEPVRLGLLKDLEDMAADGTFADMRMRRIAGSITVTAAPQRISESAYFKFLHDEVPRSLWQRKAIRTPANCIACHPRANDGRYGEREVRIPQ